MFVGKCGIFDHSWSAKGQSARIYRTQVVRDESITTRAGDPYCYLKGWAYMVRTDSNTDLIAEIEGGIKKEISVGCAVERSVCSICGQEMGSPACPHRKGEEYDGRLCYGELTGARDAYEFSFVAVPAQPGAGVLREKRLSAGSLEELKRRCPDCRKELEELEREARTGRAFLDELRRDVVRLGLLARCGLEGETLKRMADKLDREELTALKTAYERQAARRYPLAPQISPREKDGHQADDQAFLI